MENKYLKQFFHSNSAADLLPIFGNYKRVEQRNKEITESLGMLEAAISYAKLDRKAGLGVYVVGDGTYPRTSMIFAYYTSWHVVGIDPEYNMSWINAYKNFKAAEGRSIKRISFLDTNVNEKEITEEFYLTNSEILIVLPHSHASMTETMECFGKVYNEDMEFTVINMPCCTNPSTRLFGKCAIDKHDYRCYIDADVTSPKNTIHIWKDLSWNNYKRLIEKPKRNFN